MLKYLKKYWWLCIIAPLFMVGEVLMDLFQPDMMGTIVDDGVLAGNVSLILSEGIKMIILVLVGGLCGFLSGVFSNAAAQSFGNDLRKDLFGRIMTLSFEQTDRFSTGSLVTRLTNDVTQVQTMVQMSLRMLVRNAMMFVGGIYFLYRQAGEFALVAIIVMPFLVAIVFFFLKKATPYFSTVQEKLDGVNNVMQEDVAGARVVKAYVKEDFELARFDRANDELCGVNLKVQTILAFMSPCMNIIMNGCVVAIILIGGINVKNGGALTTGRIMAAITYIAQILHGVMFMANMFQTFTRAKASASRINEVLNSGEAVKSGTYKGEDNKLTGEIEFKNVSFAYPGDQGSNVLNDINLTVHKGETLAILGSTGSGKSTIVNLIPRFYDVTGGQVLVDGVDVREYDLVALRDKVSIVLQKAELYSRSVEANIRWAKDDATPWEIKSAAEIAQADDFICGMANGYYTQVTEGGHSLSGGQKQRISIARALIRKTEILIFDDSTSALDLSTEAKLYKALNEACPDVTKIIIAQRIASVRGADRIAVLDGGRIASIGTHDELMKTSPIYRDIYNSQLKEGDEPV